MNSPVDRLEKSMMMLHGRATDSIAQMNSKNSMPNKVNGNLTLEAHSVKLVLSEFNRLSASFGINVHKLLSFGIIQFTAQNDRNASTGKVNYTVVISLKEFATWCGYDVEITCSGDDSDDALYTRKKKASSTLKEFRKKIKKDLQMLSICRLSWTENVKGKDGDYIDLAIIGSHGIQRGYIFMTFDPVFAEYLLRLPLTCYPASLLSIDARSGNAYSLGLKMSEHFCLDRNHHINTAQLLKVETLLKYTSLPTIETIREQRTSWDARIRIPFEKALNALVEAGLLETWSYSHSKGILLTTEEQHFCSYEEWSQILVFFTLKNASAYYDCRKLRDNNDIPRSA